MDSGWSLGPGSPEAMGLPGGGAFLTVLEAGPGQWQVDLGLGCRGGGRRLRGALFPARPSSPRAKQLGAGDFRIQTVWFPWELLIPVSGSDLVRTQCLVTTQDQGLEPTLRLHPEQARGHFSLDRSFPPPCAWPWQNALFARGWE